MSRGGHVQRHGWRRVVVVAGIVLGVLVLGAVAGAFAATRYERAHADTILPGVRIGGVDVGGMTRGQAKAAVKAAVAAPLGTDFTISVGDRRWVTSPLSSAAGPTSRARSPTRCEPAPTSTRCTARGIA